MNDDLILVTGGTGHLGRHLVAELLRQRRRIRVFARLPGTDPRVQWARGDLATGQGLDEALAGVGTVVNTATFSPIAQRGRLRLIDFLRTPSDVDVQGTRRLLQASRQARVQHLIHVSITGLHPQSPLPYNRVKLAGENLVRESDLPWSIVQAAPFHYLMARLLGGMRFMPWWPLPDVPMQPVDTTDVATYLAQCTADGRRGVREPIVGPEVMAFPSLARQYLEARGLRRRVLPLKISATRAERMGFTTTAGRHGRVSWREWLQTHDDEPGGRVRTQPLPALPFET